jgi:hypothetical protein
MVKASLWLIVFCFVSFSRGQGVFEFSYFANFAGASPVIGPNGTTPIGNDWTAGVYLGSDTRAEPLATTTIFQNTGLWLGPKVVVSNTAPGQIITVSVAVWPTVFCSLQGAVEAGALRGVHGASQSLGGTNQDGTIIPIPLVDGFRGFTMATEALIPGFAKTNLTFAAYTKPPETWTKPGVFDLVPEGTNLFAGEMIVTNGTAKYVRSLWPDATGDQSSIELPGNGSAVTVKLSAIPGFGHHIKFWLSANPQFGPGESTVKTIRVSMADQQQTYTFDSGQIGNSTNDMKWRQCEFIFYPTPTMVEYVGWQYFKRFASMKFENLTPTGSAGPVIDGVSLEYWLNGSLSISEKSSDTISVSFPTCRELPYQLQTRDNPSTEWTDIGPKITGDGTVKNIDQPLDRTQPGRVYRVKATPVR